MRAGDKVVLTSGPYAKAEAEILSIEGESALVRVSFFGRAIEQRVELAALSTRADPGAVRARLEHAASLLRANTHDRWWAARLGAAGDPIAEYREFEEHALAYDAAIGGELDAIEAELRGISGLPPSGWIEEQIDRLGSIMPQPGGAPEQLLAGRERRQRALAALEAAGEAPRYVGTRRTP